MRRNNMKAAVSDFDVAIRYAPQEVRLYTARGNAKRRMGDEAGAQADFRKSREMKK